MHDEQMGLMEKLDRRMGYMALDPDNVNLILDALGLALELQQWDIATEICAGREALVESSKEFAALQGYLLLARGEIVEAEKCLASSITAGSQAPNIFYNHAYACLLLRKFDAALESIHAIEKSSPLALSQSLLKARILSYQQDTASAVEILQQAHMAEVTAESAGLLALLMYDDDQPETAAMLWAEKSLALDPHCLEALIAKGHILFEQDQVDSAKSAMTLATQQHPKAGRAWSLLGQIYFFQFAFDDAIQALTLAVQYMPDHIGTWHLLGWSHLMQGDVTAAKAAFDASYDLDRTFGETHAALAAVYTMQNNREMADKHLKRANKLDKDTLGQEFVALVNLLRENKVEEARDYLAQFNNKFRPGLGIKPGDLVEKRLRELRNKMN